VFINISYISYTLSSCFVISQFFRTCLPELRARLACLWGFLISQPSIGVASSLKVYQMKWIEMVEGGIHHDPIGYVPRKGAHPFTIFLQLVADDLSSRLQPARTRAGAGQGDFSGCTWKTL